MTIRPETPQDHTHVYELLTCAFGRTDEAELVERLRHSAGFISALSLVAEQENKIIGHILFSRISIVNDERQADSLALAPVSVLPEYQRQGVGKALIVAGLEASKKEGHTSVIVLGHAGYYPQFGFQPASRWHIKSPFEVPDEVFMALELREGALTGVSGTVVYSSAF